MDDAHTLDRIMGSTHLVNAPDTLPPQDAADGAHLRKPPHSAEAEQSALGALLLDPGAFAKVSDKLLAADFFSNAHRLILEAITGLIGEAAAVDVISVFERLERDGHATDAGGLAYLNLLAQSVPSSANLPRYVEIIAERATLRRLIGLLDEATTRAFRNEPSISILDDAKVALGKIAEGRVAGAGRVPLLTLAQLREQSHAATWLVKHLLPTECKGLLFGSSGTFKSFVAVDLACHVAHGLPWLGRRTVQGPVVYLAAEGGGGLWKRVCAWHKARKLPWANVPLHVIPAALDLTQDAWRVAEALQLASVNPVLVIIDTLSQTYGGEENSSSEVSGYFRAVASFIQQRWHCAVLFLHHTGHTATERPRGSSAMQANTDFMFGVFRDEKELLATLTCAHVKDGERFHDAIFALSHQTLGTDEDGDEIKSLVARHLTSAEELQQVMEREAKAGRGGSNHLLLSLLQNGTQESDLRTAFMRDCKGDTPEARKKAYLRAKDWATQAGLMEISQGWVITLKPGGGQA